MLQAITTRFHGPTNTRGSRVSARCAAGSVSLSWAHNLNPDQNHRAAAEALAREIGWNVPGGHREIAGFRLTGGETYDGKGCVFVITSVFDDGQSGAEWRKQLPSPLA